MNTIDDGIDVLVRRAQAGDDDAMSRLLTQIQPIVVGRCARLLLFRGDAEEAAQDALLNIATRLQSFDPARGSFLGWVTVVASNSARSTYRSLKRRSREQTMESAPETVDPHRTSVVAGSRIDLLEALEALEREHPAVVEAFVLRDIASLPYGEIADLTGVPLGTVKGRIHDARAFMRAQLVEQLT
jgi:RNA polymerase sigma factor (sigma-70 family)